VRSSTTTQHNSATTAEASLAGKKVFLGNNRSVNGRIACLGDSGHDKSGEQFVSGDIANARDWEGDYDEFTACRNSLAKFTKSCHRGDSD
jgi:hypothetical protein